MQCNLVLEAAKVFEVGRIAHSFIFPTPVRTALLFSILFALDTGRGGGLRKTV